MYQIRDRHCGQIAFWVTRELLSGELLQAQDFQHVDGTPFQTGERCDCDHCGTVMIQQDAWVMEPIQ